MRTLYDLEAVFTELADEAPAVLARSKFEAGRPDHRRRRALASIAAAIALVAAAALGLARTEAAQRSSDAPPAHSTSAAPARCHGLAVAIVPPGATYVPSAASPVPCAVVQQYAVGAFDPSSITDAVPVRVGETQGFFGRLPAVARSVEHGSRGVPSLAWQTSSGAWQVLQARTIPLQTQTTELGLTGWAGGGDAEHDSQSTTPAPSHDMPYWFGFIPPAVHQQWACAVADTSETVVTNTSVNVENSYSADRRTSLVSAVYGPDASPGTPPQPPVGADTITVQGHTVYIGTTTIDVTLGSYAINLAYSGPSATRAGLVEIAEHLEFPKDIIQRNTWFSCEDS